VYSILLLLTSFLSNDLVTSVAVRGASPDVKFATQVGEPFNTERIDQDIRRLWDTGRFEDIRVETAEQNGGTAVLFWVVPSPILRLHDVRIEPSSYALRIKPPEGTPLNRLRAHLIAEEAKTQLEQRGYVDPQVDYEFVPFAKGLADLKLKVRATDPARVRRIDFSGDTFLDARHELHALHTRRILSWKLAPSYSEQAVSSDLVRIQSLYLSHGYFDAQVRAQQPEWQSGNAVVHISIDAGARYDVRNPISCPALLAQRREAQHEGILDFDVRAELRDGELETNVVRGPAYRVGRINFSGHHHFGDTVIRRNFVLDEAAPFDEYKLRKSIARLNRTNFFEPIDVKDVLISPDESKGVADVNVRLTERKLGKWSLSGPVGTTSFAGPLQGAVTARVPWIPTFTASISLVAFRRPIIPGIPVQRFVPVAALERAFIPGNSWLSGIVIVPQLGWPMMAMSYGSAQLKQRLTPLLAGNRGLISELPVTIATPTGEKTMLCEPPEPRFYLLRRSAAFGLQLLTALPSL